MKAIVYQKLTQFSTKQFNKLVLSRMKSVILILFLGFVCVNGQSGMGLDFLVDNLLNPLINNISTNTVNYLISQLLGLFGKRDLNASQLINQVHSAFNDYKDNMSVVIQNYFAHVQNIFNIFNLAGPQKSIARIDYIRVLSETEAEMKKEAFNLVNILFSIFQSLFGQNFADDLTSTSRGVFVNITSIINNFTTTVTTILNNLGDSLLESASNIAQISAPLFNNLGQEIINNAGTAVQQINQAISNLGVSFSG